MKPTLLILAAAIAASAFSQSIQAQNTPQQVPAAAPTPSGFPAPPAKLTPQTGTSTGVPVQQSHFGPETYAPGTLPQPQQNSNSGNLNGVAPLPPLTPPTAMQLGESAVSPLTPAQIVQMRKQVDRTRRAKAYRPVRAVPRISSVTVDLSPGSALPIARMLPGETSTLLFLDAAGAPWPLATAPRVSDNRYFDAEWLQGTAAVIISALSPYEDGNLSVMLQGSPTPVVIKLVTGEPDSKSNSRIVDYRLDLRIPGRAPGSPAGVLGPDKISLYDDTMQNFLDGMPPRTARLVKTSGARASKTRVWALDGYLYVRTDLDIQTAFDQSMAAGDGTHVYKLPPTPFVTFSQGGNSITLQLDIE